MPRRRRTARPRLRELSNAQYWELWLGAVGNGAYTWVTADGTTRSNFPDPEVRREAWWANRAQLMRHNPGVRPWGWWLYESGLGGRLEAGEGVPRDRDATIIWLAENGHLEPDEAGVLLSWAEQESGGGDDDRRPAYVVERRRRQAEVAKVLRCSLGVREPAKG